MIVYLNVEDASMMGGNMIYQRHAEQYRQGQVQIVKIAKGQVFRPGQGEGIYSTIERQVQRGSVYRLIVMAHGDEETKGCVQLGGEVLMAGNGNLREFGEFIRPYFSHHTLGILLDVCCAASGNGESMLLELARITGQRVVGALWSQSSQARNPISNIGSLLGDGIWLDSIDGIEGEYRVAHPNGTIESRQVSVPRPDMSMSTRSLRLIM